MFGRLVEAARASDKMKSLSGTFRTTDREKVAMIKCRTKLKLSINQIAQVMRRSTSTVYKYVGIIARVDNRRLTPSMRSKRNAIFQRNIMNLRFRLKLYLHGIGTFDDIFLRKSFPLAAVDWFRVSENYGDDE